MRGNSPAIRFNTTSVIYCTESVCKLCALSEKKQREEIFVTVFKACWKLRANSVYDKHACF